MNDRRLLVAVAALWAAWLVAVVAIHARRALSTPREVYDETARAGDFDGDGRADLVTFTRDSAKAAGRIYVALSDGRHFLDRRGERDRSSPWSESLANSATGQILVGDFDGDGRDDVASWLGMRTRQIHVALSTAHRLRAPTLWADDVGFDESDSFSAGDVNGDGRDDVICFSPSTRRIAVLFSNGASFDSPQTDSFEMH